MAVAALTNVFNRQKLAILLRVGVPEPSSWPILPLPGEIET